jgi:hypothetical protein
MWVFTDAGSELSGIRGCENVKEGM